jgi:hypothetical protein
LYYYAFGKPTPSVDSGPDAGPSPPRPVLILPRNGFEVGDVNDPVVLVDAEGRPAGAQTDQG